MADGKNEILTKEIHEAMIRAIFGSNQIERAGLDLDLTVHLCRKVFAGEFIGELSERDPDYQAQLLELYQKQPSLKGCTSTHVLRSRNEVVQHARAFQHILHAFVVQNQDLTEELIKETHRILVTGVPIVEHGGSVVQPDEYGGVYRTIVVGAGNTNFVVPRFVPSKMKEMCDNLKQELAAAHESKTIDPFSVASKYSMEFVQIHPFRDGNGRMCRLILNSILCRYAGVIIPIGEQGTDREDYIKIKQQASEEMGDHGKYATFVLEKATRRLRELKKKLAGKKGISEASGQSA